MTLDIVMSEIKHKFFKLVENELDTSFDWNCINPEDMEKMLKWEETTNKYNDLINANSEVVQNNISLSQLHQENKKLSDELKGCKKFAEGVIDGYDEVKGERDHFKNESKQLKSQILEDQKIVDGVCALWKSCQVMIDSYQEQIDNIETNGLNESFLEIQLEKELFVRRHMEDMVLFKTGKDIKEILKDDK